MDVLNKKYLTVNGENKFYVKNIGIVGDTNSRGFRLRINNDLGDEARVSMLCRVGEQTYITVAEKDNEDYILKFPNAAFINPGNIEYQIRIQEGESIAHSKRMKAYVDKSIVSLDETIAEDTVSIDFINLAELSKLNLAKLKSVLEKGEDAGVNKEEVLSVLNDVIGDLSEYKLLYNQTFSTDKESIKILDLVELFKKLSEVEIEKIKNLIESSDTRMAEINKAVESNKAAADKSIEGVKELIASIDTSPEIGKSSESNDGLMSSSDKIKLDTYPSSYESVKSELKEVIEKINENVGDLSEFKDVIEKDNISVLDVLTFYVNMLTQRIAQTDELIERSDLPVINILLNDLSSKVSSLESQKTHNIWTGTQDEFNEIESKDDKTIYLVMEND